MINVITRAVAMAAYLRDLRPCDVPQLKRRLHDTTRYLDRRPHYRNFAHRTLCRFVVLCALKTGSFEAEVFR